MWDEAVRETSEGLLIDLDVRPGSPETRIRGYNVWRHSLTVDVAAAPEDGAANRALESLFRGFWRGCEAKVVRGTSSRHKTVLVRGIARADLLAAIAGRQS